MGFPSRCFEIQTLIAQVMKNQLLIAGTILFMLSGCVTETTYVGKDTKVESIDRQAAAKNRLGLGLGYLDKGDMSQAKFNLDRALAYDPSNPEVYIARAYYFQRVGDQASAEDTYRKVLGMYPSNADALNNYGVYLCNQKRYSDAESRFDQALKVPDYSRMDDTYENAALCAQQAGHVDQAAKYYDLALGYNPNRGKLLLAAAELALKQQNPGKAASYLQRFSRGGTDTAQSLWLQLQVAQSLGELAAVHRYGQSLAQQFPHSDQARRYLNNDY